MCYTVLFILVVLSPCPAAVAPAAPLEKPAAAPVVATVETTLASADGQIRQLAFDGDPSSYFASAQNAGRPDHFTLVFDKPVAVKAIIVTTGRPQGGDLLDAGNLEGSADGKKFEPLARFAEGVSRC